MKNIGLLCLFWMGLLIPLKAQITVTNAVFPAVGDILHYATDNEPAGIVITPPGGSQQWDFTSLQPMLTWQQVFQDARDGADYESFPTATLYYQTGVPDVEAYLTVSDQEVALLGFSGPDPTVLDIDLIARYNPPVVQSRAPVQFFDIKAVSSGLLIPFTPDRLPGSNQLPLNADSMRIRVAVNRLDVVDAWGALSIPGGSFDVLREKRTQYHETRLDAKVPPLGWLDITDVAVQYLQLSALGVDTTVSYYFLNDQSKEVIAACLTDNSQLRVISVQYKNVGISTGIKKTERSVADLAVFPNPAGEVLQIRANILAGEDYSMVIYTTQGQEVFRKTFGKVAGKLEEAVDITGLQNGAYVCKISNAGGQAGQALFVKQ